jgi:hypothetical protein
MAERMLFDEVIHDANHVSGVTVAIAGDAWIRSDIAAVSRLAAALQGLVDGVLILGRGCRIVATTNDQHLIVTVRPVSDHDPDATVVDPAPASERAWSLTVPLPS